ncbi:MAG: 50S ribosomal protein L25 [Candidatus Paceibacterota bacterium]
MDLKVKNRETLGKKVKTLRKEGFIPGELFGHGFENNHVKVDRKNFKDVYKKAGKNTIINIEIEGGEKMPALIYGVQIHPISREPIAIDFYRIRDDEKITTKIPIIFGGEAPAEEKDLVVLTLLDELEIESLPKDIPHEIKVDLSSIEGLEDKILVKDLNIPKNVDVQVSEDAVIVSVSEKQEEVIDETPEPTTLPDLEGDILGDSEEESTESEDADKESDSDDPLTDNKENTEE